ncbi:MAG: site-2 protease family protein [Anaerolineales bacterium]|nr:site-2 protease family protein [Anaerolineales bacterium]
MNNLQTQPNGSPPGPVVPLDKVEALRLSVSHLFTTFDTALDQPHPGYVRFRGHFLQDPAHCFDELRSQFERHGFTPMIRREKERTLLIALPVVFRDQPSNPWVNLLLLIATIFSTLLIGATYDAPLGEGLQNLWRGWPFSLSIMLILGAHELGHYFAARYHKVPVTLPYFIPLPFPQVSLFGTLGAFIRLKAPVKNRRALFDVGAAGPLAGLVFAVPILLYGLFTSELGQIGPGPVLLEGNSLLYALAKLAIFGQLLPNGTTDVFLNQVAWAGWVGLLVTGLNLLPVGQLDGGHVAYVLFGKRARQLFWPILLALGALVIFTGTLTWAIWIVLLFFVGRYHAEPLDDVTPLDRPRKIVAVATLILFFFVFVPIPIQIIQ